MPQNHVFTGGPEERKNVGTQLFDCVARTGHRMVVERLIGDMLNGQLTLLLP